MRWGRHLAGAVSPGELGAPFARQVSLALQLPATPALPLWEEKIDFSDHTGASSLRPRSWEQLHSCLALYT